MDNLYEFTVRVSGTVSSSPQTIDTALISAVAGIRDSMLHQLNADTLEISIDRTKVEGLLEP